MILNEPVRGSIPPPWFLAIPGIERLRLFIEGLLPLPPIWRLLGIRPAHIGPGSCTWIMPASGSFQGMLGTLDLTALIETALNGAVLTTLPANTRVNMLTLEVNYFRPTRPQSGNLLARARVINQSQFFSFAQVEVEDPRGRQVAHGVGHMEIVPVTDSLPRPPDQLQPVEEPTYATPDPYLRDVPIRLPPPEAWAQHSGLDILHRVIDGTYISPFTQMMGSQFIEAEKGRVVIAIPANDWFSRFSRCLAPSCLATLSNAVGAVSGITLMEPNQSFVGINHVNHFYRTTPADGRLLRAEGQVLLRREGLLSCDIHVYDADGEVLSWGRGLARLIDSAKRQKRLRPTAKRILTTLMFTDIVGSTNHIQRLGDAGWQSLLEQYRTLVREELSQRNGIEVDTNGDGFFVRFDAPADALGFALAMRNRVKRWDLEMRMGIHVGECDIKSGKLTGMTVHIAARIEATATPGEIWVSATVKELVNGSELHFEDRGQHTLKGVPGQWQLHSLVKRDPKRNQ